MTAKSDTGGLSVTKIIKFWRVIRINGIENKIALLICFGNNLTILRLWSPIFEFGTRRHSDCKCRTRWADTRMASRASWFAYKNI